MKKLLWILVSMIAIVLIIGAGCQKQQEAAAKTTAKETAADKTVEQIKGDISDIGTVGDDINISDLDSLEKELDNINW